MHLMWKAFFLKVASYKTYRNTHWVKKKHINAIIVIRLSHRKLNLQKKQNMWECTLVRNHINAINVIEAFTNHNIFRHHLKKHTEEKTHQCTQCDETFSQKQTFIEHIIPHTGEKQYQCNQCDRGFTQKSDLEENVRMHTGEKPYQWIQCDKGFYKS